MKRNTFKNFIFKTLNFILNLIMLAGALYSLFVLVLQFIPVEYSNAVYVWLNANVNTLIPASISTSVTTVVLFLAKFGHTAIKVLIKNSEMIQEGFRKNLENKISEQIKDVEMREDATILLLNQVTEKQNLIEKLLIRANKYDELIAEKNIASSIIPPKLKEDLKLWKNDVSKEIKESKKIFKETEYITTKKVEEAPKEEKSPVIERQVL